MNDVLSDIRVLDFGRYVAGPYCATLLGYMGADVIRVERLGGAEDRAIAPVTKDGEGAVFLQTACNKRSVCLDLRSGEGKDIARRLVRSADVVVANFPAQTLKKLGLDLDSLQALKPDIILANVTAFGEEGPWVNRGGFDGVGQAMSGAMYITGTPGGPAKAAAPYVDYCSAVLAALGVMAALRERDQSGQGQQVSGTLLGTALSVFNSHLVEQGVLGIDRVGTGNRVQTSAPSDVFATGDGHVLVHCPGDAVFRRWARLLDLEEWIDDPRFATDQDRGDHRDEICAPMVDWCAGRSTEEALETLAAAGIPAGPVLSPREALDHPQVAALDLLRSVDYPGAPAPAPVAGLPFKRTLGGPDVRNRPPLVGEHTDEVMTELGFSQDQIAALRSAGAVG
ncbi:MAG: CoA transferase [Xanthomonadales bacterium]|nr:CoA transferase [Xanthomonadales bacterium]